METVCKLLFNIVTLPIKSQEAPFMSIVKVKVIRQFWEWDPKLEMLTEIKYVGHAEGLLSYKVM